jgi:hypothetical protein
VETRVIGLTLSILSLSVADSIIVSAEMQSQPQSSCISNRELNTEFEIINGGSIPREGSCCMMDVCGLTCPESTTPPDSGKSSMQLEDSG